MTVTRDQAQMLATLAVNCRPHRAPTWDHAGVMAAIAQIREMSLPEVILRVIRAAADRDAQTPGVIPKNGPHANEQLKPPKWEPNIVPPEDRCGICSHHRHDGKCTRCAPNEDHAWEPDFKTKRGPDVIEIVDALKAELAPMRDPATTRTPEPGAGQARLEDSHE